MAETKWFKVLSMIHLIAILSLCFMGSCLISLTILFLPATCAVFAVGRELIEGRYNVYDGLIGIFWKEMFRYKKSLRFLPVWLLLILQTVGIWAAQNMGLFYLQVILLAGGAFLLTYLFYVCSYIVFCDEGVRCEVVLVKMFRHIGILLSLFCLMVLVMVFFQLRFLPVLALCGSFFLLVVEAVIYTTLKAELEKEEGAEGYNKNEKPRC